MPNLHGSALDSYSTRPDTALTFGTDAYYRSVGNLLSPSRFTKGGFG